MTKESEKRDIGAAVIAALDYDLKAGGWVKNIHGAGVKELPPHGGPGITLLDHYAGLAFSALLRAYHEGNSEGFEPIKENFDYCFDYAFEMVQAKEEHRDRFIREAVQRKQDDGPAPITITNRRLK